MVFSLFLLCAVAYAQNTVQLDPFADNSIRVRVFPPGNPVSDPPLQALLPTPPSLATLAVRSGVNTLTNGNLRITVDPATSLVTATRVSDGVTLLKQTVLSFGIPDVPTTRAGSVSTLVTFAGTVGEKVYGLGEHRTGSVNMMPYSKRFADSQDYGKSHGSDVSIPWYASSLGYGFLWNSPAYGSVEVSEEAITWRANASMGVDFWVTTLPATFEASSGTSPYAPLLSQYVDAVGHASTMPYYATGFIQCKDRYRNQSQVRALRSPPRYLHWHCLTYSTASPSPPHSNAQLLDVARGYVERELPIRCVEPRIRPLPLPLIATLLSTL
jgi:alpha-D-xyloside xylohydrolase